MSKHTNIDNEIEGTYHNYSEMSDWVFWFLVIVVTLSCIAVLGWIFGLADTAINFIAEIFYEFRN